MAVQTDDKKEVVTRRDYNENDDGVDNDVYTKKTQWKRKYTNNHTSQTRLMHIVPGDTKLPFFQPKPFQPSFSHLTVKQG